jgi:hypothetical protein
VNDIKIIEKAYHRNGIAGEGFWAVRFQHTPDDTRNAKPETFVATLFDGAGRCAVLSVDRLAAVGVKFGVNSWRGDVFEDDLRRAINEGGDE